MTASSPPVPGHLCAKDVISRMDTMISQIDTSKRRLAATIETGDHVGLSFQLATGMMLAATAFFFFQAALVPRRWANSMVIAGLVTGVAWNHYSHMKEVWAERQDELEFGQLTIYRYMDWLITVPLQVTEFFCVLSASNPNKDFPVPISIAFRLMISSIIMLVAGYLGETSLINRWLAFAFGMSMWLYIVYEISFGEAASVNGELTLAKTKRMINTYLRASMTKEEGEEDLEDTTELQMRKDIEMRKKKETWGIIQNIKREALGVTNLDNLASQEFKKSEAQLAFEVLRGILILGWLLYPAGYVAGGDATTLEQETILNVIYNVADLINKVAFGLAIWFAASSSVEREKEVLSLAMLPTAATLTGQKMIKPVVELADWKVWKDESEALEELERRAKIEMDTSAENLAKELAEEKAMADRAKARMSKL